jgi:hypothetical protein
MSKSTTRNIPAVDTDAAADWFDGPSLRSAAELNLASRDEDGNITLNANLDLTGTLTGTAMDHRDAERLAEAVAIIELYATADMKFDGGPAVVSLHKAALDFNFKRIELGLPELQYAVATAEVGAAWCEQASNKLYRVGRFETARPIKMSSESFSDVTDPQIIFCHMNSSSQYFKPGVATCMAIAYTPSMYRSGIDKQTNQPYTYPDLWNDYKGYTHIVRFFPDGPSAEEASVELAQAVRTIRELEPLAPKPEAQYGEQLPLARRYQQGVKLTAG